MKGNQKIVLMLGIAVLLAVALFATSGIVSTAAAQDKPKGPGQGAPSGMQEPSQADMEAMMKLAQPGEYHKVFDRMVGTWKTTIKMYMGPEPTVSEGTAKYEWILGNRYMKSTHTGNFNGMPFEGMGIDGYDNAKGEYFSTWYDNMGTGVMMLTGKRSPDGKSITYTGTSFDPMQKKDVGVREEITWLDDTHYHFVMYMEMPGPDGTPMNMKAMEMSAEKQ
jgi:hypothetical protein